MLTVHKQRIPFLLLLLPLQLVLVMLNVLVTEVISTSVLVPQLTTVVHPAANRETPKPTGREGINSPSHQWLYLIYLKDILKNRDFLVDTGASRSVFPHQSSAAPTGPGFLMADGRPDKAGFQNPSFAVSLPQFSVFVPVSCGGHILEADFLAEFDLLVDPAKSQVLQLSSLKPLAPPCFSLANSAVSSVFMLVLMLPRCWTIIPLPGNPDFLVNCQNTMSNM